MLASRSALSIPKASASQLFISGLRGCGRQFPSNSHHLYPSQQNELAFVKFPAQKILCRGFWWGRKYIRMGVKLVPTKSTVEIALLRELSSIRWSSSLAGALRWGPTPSKQRKSKKELVMHVAIIGASAGVGALCTIEALARGHTVATLSRRITSFTTAAFPGLTQLQGDATKVEDLLRVISGADAILVAVGTGTSTKATTLYSQTARALVDAMRQVGNSPPVILLTGFGAGSSGEYQSLPMRLIFRLLLKDVYVDKTAMEFTIESSGLKWVIVRPGRLIDSSKPSPIRVETHNRKGMAIGAISRLDVAIFMMDQAEAPTLLYCHVAICSA